MNQDLNAKALAEYETKMSNYVGDDEIINSTAMAEKLKQVSATDNTIATKYPDLDRYIEGFEPGELIVVSGKPGSGKTLFMQTLTRNISEEGYGICWFSYELLPNQLFRCFPKLPYFYLPKQLTSANMR